MCEARGKSTIKPRDHDKLISSQPLIYHNLMCKFLEVDQEATFQPTFDLSQRLTPSQAKLVDKVYSSVKGTSYLDCLMYKIQSVELAFA